MEHGPLPATAVDPLFVADESGAGVPGRLGDGRAGLVRKRFPGWTSVFSAAPLLPAELYRALALRAGAHFHTDSSDCLFASRGCVALTADTTGRKTIRLPEPCRVHDAFGGRDLGVRQTVEFDLDACDTKLLFLGPQGGNAD